MNHYKTIAGCNRHITQVHVKDKTLTVDEAKQYMYVEDRLPPPGSQPPPTAVVPLQPPVVPAPPAVADMSHEPPAVAADLLPQPSAADVSLQPSAPAADVPLELPAAVADVPYPNCLVPHCEYDLFTSTIEFNYHIKDIHLKDRTLCQQSYRAFMYLAPDEMEPYEHHRLPLIRRSKIAYLELVAASKPDMGPPSKKQKIQTQSTGDQDSEYVEDASSNEVLPDNPPSHRNLRPRRKVCYTEYADPALMRVHTSRRSQGDDQQERSDAQQEGSDEEQPRMNAHDLVDGCVAIAGTASDPWLALVTAAIDNETFKVCYLHPVSHEYGPGQWKLGSGDDGKMVIEKSVMRTHHVVTRMTDLEISEDGSVTVTEDTWNRTKLLYEQHMVK